MGALVGARTCGRCGGRLADGAAWCHHCGVRNVGAAPGSALGTYAGMLAGVKPAAPGRRRAATAIDVGLPLLLAGLAVAASVTDLAPASGAGAALVPSLVGLAVALVVVDLALWTAAGRSTGRLLLGLRTVDDLTGRPPAAARLDRRGRPTLRRRTVTVDLHAGRDPLHSSPPAAVRPVLEPAPVAPPRRSTAAGRPDELTWGRGGPDGAARHSPTWDTARGSTALAEATAAVLVLDSGERLEVETSLLLGRAPVVPEGDDHPVFAWADLERSLTKTHALLERQGGVLWVTDLGSTNGSSLVAPDGTRQPLVPGLRGAAGPGYVLEFGERTATVQPSAVVDA